MSKFTFTKKETNKKNQAFEYSVTDEAGNVLMTRGSNREYIAVMVCQDKDGKIYVPNFFFSRLDLVGKGDSRYEVKNQIATAVLE